MNRYTSTDRADQFGIINCPSKSTDLFQLSIDASIDDRSIGLETLRLHPASEVTWCYYKFYGYLSTVPSRVVH